MSVCVFARVHVRLCVIVGICVGLHGCVRMFVRMYVNVLCVYERLLLCLQLIIWFSVFAVRVCVCCASSAITYVIGHGPAVRFPPY